MAEPCKECGEVRWAAAGFCMSLQCAGHYLDPDYPKNAPPEHKWYKDDAPKRARGRGGKARRPRKGALRSTELWYESRGETPPWKKDDDNHA